MSKKRMTIEDLAIMVARGFEDVYKRLDTMVTRDEFNERFDSFEEKIENKYGSQIEKFRDDMRIVKTNLKLES